MELFKIVCGKLVICVYDFDWSVEIRESCKEEVLFYLSFES